MTALTMKELQDWVERTATGWRQLLRDHPEAMQIPCDVRETSTVAELLQHIVAVELRYAQRLQGIPESPYDEIAHGSAEEIFATHEEAMQLLSALTHWTEADWEERLTFTTRSAGTMSATRRTILVHLLMHSIRHYAQLATLVRQHGIKPDWGMDYLLMGARQEPA